MKYFPSIFYHTTLKINIIFNISYQTHPRLTTNVRAPVSPHLSTTCCDIPPSLSFPPTLGETHVHAENETQVLCKVLLTMEPIIHLPPSLGSTPSKSHWGTSALTPRFPMSFRSSAGWMGMWGAWGGNQPLVSACLDESGSSTYSSALHSLLQEHLPSLKRQKLEPQEGSISLQFLAPPQADY